MNVTLESSTEFGKRIAQYTGVVFAEITPLKDDEAELLLKIEKWEDDYLNPIRVDSETLVYYDGKQVFPFIVAEEDNT